MAIAHQVFRRVFVESAQLVRANPAPSPARVTFLADHIDFAVYMLHHHHANEDAHLYPLLIERAPEEAATTERIEAEHREVEGHIEAVAAACAAWRKDPTAETGEALGRSCVSLNEALEPHLDHEENVVVPLAARTLTQQEWDQLGKQAVEHIPRDKQGVAFGMLVEPLSQADTDYMKRTLPAPVRLLYPFMIERPWKRYAATLRGGT